MGGAPAGNRRKGLVGRERGPTIYYVISRFRVPVVSLGGPIPTYAGWAVKSWLYRQAAPGRVGSVSLGDRLSLTIYRLPPNNRRKGP